jgi:aspartokinase/homoserine dehydrogenase 1
MKILKFGGTSMGSKDSLIKVSQIIKNNFEQKIKQIIVCSAMSGVTDKLLQMGNLAEKTELK